MSAAMLLASVLAQPPTQTPDAAQPAHSPATSEAQTPAADRARDAIEEALELVDEGQLDAALDVVLKARANNDDPRLPYMEGQLRRLSGDCPGALQAYREFLATDPTGLDREYTLASIEECGGQPEPTVAPASVPDARPPPPTAAPTPTSGERSPGPVPRRPRTDVALWAVGGSSVAVGVGLLVASAGVRAKALGGDVGLERYLRQERTSIGLGIGGVVVTTAGAAILSAALIRHIRGRKRP